MSEHETREQTEQAEATEEVEDPKGAEKRREKASAHNGHVVGLPGKRVVVNGVLDLRGVPVAQLAEAESITVNGVVLLDEGNRNGLAGVRSVVNGTVTVVDPDTRVMVEPSMDLTKATVEAMPAGQKVMLVGNVFFKPDVPPGLIAEKFENLHVVGILIACEGVYGALMGKMERTGVSVTLPDDVGAVVRSVGVSRWTKDYLERLADGTTYVNVGVTRVRDDVPEELVERKIASYHNVGVTRAPEAILALLKSRCGTDQGTFKADDKGERE